MQGDTQKLVGNNTQDLENRVQIPLRKNFEWRGKWVSLVTKHGRIQDSKTNYTGNRSQDDDREDIEEIVGPGRFTVIVVAHALGELRPHLGVGQIWLLENVHQKLQVMVEE